MGGQNFSFPPLFDSYRELLLKSRQKEPKLSPLTLSRSGTPRPSNSSKLKELKRNLELKKLMAEQALELAKYEAEMEKKKLTLKCKNRKWLRRCCLEPNWKLNSLMFLLKSSRKARPTLPLEAYKMR